MKGTETSRSGWSSGLNAAALALLYQIAVDTLEACVHSPAEPFSWDRYDIPNVLCPQTATFVTLHQKELGLRGCIGTLEPVAPLYVSVHENTIAAARRDPRFQPVQVAELPHLQLTVSILSPADPIASVDEFVPGKHGIILEKSGRRSVFLPEVAAEQGWTREDTLRALCVKAGLPQDAWQTNAHFSVFHSAILSGSGPLF